MSSLDIQGLSELDETLNSLIEQAPERRKELHEELSDLLKQTVDTSIGSSGLRTTDRVRRWQVKHVGSKGGYAAIRPAGSKEGAEVGKKGPGAITQYLEDGHKIREPSGTSKHYRPRIKVSYVSGYHFYQQARTSIEAEAIRIGERFADRLVDQIEGSI